jgi:hypothetical protein
MISLVTESESLCFVTNCTNASYAGFENVDGVELVANCTCWADLLKVKHFYLKNKHMRVGNGEAASL